MAGKVRPSIVGFDALDHAAGDNPSLRLVLQQLTAAANTQATKTNTSGKNPPNQSSLAISFQAPLYVLTFTDPGGAAAASLSQAAQQAAAVAAPLGSNPTQSVIYHQIQAATSILFDLPSHLRTYGGEVGSLQTQFVIADLAISKSWLFRFRTSYDGVTWNQWKLASKTGTSVNVNAVVTSNINGGQFAGVTLLGKQLVGFGMGIVPSGQAIQTAQGVLLRNSFGIAAPAGYVDTGYETIGLSACGINSLGQVTMNYRDGGGNRWLGSANYLTFGWVAGGAQNLTEQTLGDGGVWIVLTMPGGSRIAIGSGTIASGSAFLVPAGFTAANSMGVCSPLNTFVSGHPAYGVNQATVTAGTVVMNFADSIGNVWPSTANWFAIAWEPALSGNLVAVAGGQYLAVPTLSGSVMIGTGLSPDGSFLPLPPQYSYAKCQAFSTPATFINELTYAMHGVQVCSIDAGNSASTGLVACLYGTVAGLRRGSASWLAIAWP